MFRVEHLGDRTRGTLGDIDPLYKVPFKRARSRVEKENLGLRVQVNVVFNAMRCYTIYCIMLCYPTLFTLLCLNCI